MSEEQIFSQDVFDPTLKKKKKKKKPFDPEALDGGSKPAEVEEETQLETVPPSEEPEPVNDANNDLDLQLKKKKKKKKPLDLTELGGALPKDASEKGDDGDKVADDTIDFSMKKKKKSSSSAPIDSSLDKDHVDGVREVQEEDEVDHTYIQMFEAVDRIIREKNPDMLAGQKKKFIMKPPQVLRVGTKKTSFSNFTEICRMLHRQPKHLLAFLLAELGTSGSLDGQNQLIIKGRFQQKQIENVLRSYIKEYVTCHTCKSPETILQKDNRLYYIQCESCGSRRSVTSIKSGFQAVTGKRAAIRARAN